MLSSVLNSDRAIDVNIQIMRAFVKLREMIASHKDLARKLDAEGSGSSAALREAFAATGKKVVQSGIAEVMNYPGVVRGEPDMLAKIQIGRGTRLFEVDRPEILVEKETVMRAHGARPACERRVIGADLTRPWADLLTDSGFRRGQPSCWLAEGFLFYLPTDTVLELLDRISALAAPGSLLGFDIPNTTTLTHAWTRTWVEMQAQFGVPFVGTMDDPREVLAQRGWTANPVQAGDKDANYGRWPYPTIPLEVPDVPRNWFVTAKKDERA